MLDSNIASLFIMTLSKQKRGNMTYTVKDLSKLSGVTVRTLHYYDQIGLLQPAYHGDNQYRYYEEEQLLKLQQILFYRELDMPLSEIKRILLSSEFNKVKALNAHKRILKKEFDRIKQMIKTIDKTIKHVKGEITMNDEELFYGLESPRQKKYEEYLIEKGVCSREEIEQSREQAKKLDWNAMQKEWDQLLKDYVDAIQKNLSPASPIVQKIVQKQHRIVSQMYPCTKEKFIGLTQQYHSHPDWLKMFNKYHPNCLEFICEAMNIFAEQNL